FSQYIWSVEALENDQALRFTTFTADAEGGFPGNLQVSITYRLSDNNELSLEYSAKSDKDTIINLTNHSYFNLAGKGSVLKHELQIHADQVVEIGDWGIPTGALRHVENSSLDFRKKRPVGKMIAEDYDLLKFAGGYDHCYVLVKEPGLRHAATLTEPVSGICMEVHTTEPGLQLYTGNYISPCSAKGVAIKARSGICLETQHFPDSINQPFFPTTILKAGETYKSSTVHKFIY
ncbi:MAG: galactose mutarotase, partial [Lentisphaeraceae bacterium]|nr:galactose mutarotase [Lentisphaeraceae bacterium]